MRSASNAVAIDPQADIIRRKAPPRASRRTPSAQPNGGCPVRSLRSRSTIIWQIPRPACSTGAWRPDCRPARRFCIPRKQHFKGSRQKQATASSVQAELNTIRRTAADAVYEASPRNLQNEKVLWRCTTQARALCRERAMSARRPAALSRCRRQPSAAARRARQCPGAWCRRSSNKAAASYPGRRRAECRWR